MYRKDRYFCHECKQVPANPLSRKTYIHFLKDKMKECKITKIKPLKKPKPFAIYVAETKKEHKCSECHTVIPAKTVCCSMLEKSAGWSYHIYYTIYFCNTCKPVQDQS
jgi:hypothetical protein